MSKLFKFYLFQKIFFYILKLFKYVFFDALESNYLTNLELVDIMLVLKVTLNIINRESIFSKLFVKYFLL